MRTLILIAAAYVGRCAVAAEPCAFEWQPGFDATELSGTPEYGVVYDPDGDGPAPERLALVGAFTIGTSSSTRIVEWTGSNWHDFDVHQYYWPPPSGHASADACAGPNGLYISTSIAAGHSYPVHYTVERWDGAHSTILPNAALVESVTEWQGVLLASGGHGGNTFLMTGESWPVLTRTVFRDLTTHQNAVFGAATSGDRHVRRWEGEGADWVDVGPDGQAEQLFLYQGALFVRGSFRTMPNGPLEYLARWDTDHWVALPLDTDAAPTSAAVVGERLYISGPFTRAGSAAASGFAEWNGAQWTSLNFASSDQVTAIYGVNDDLIATGRFASIGDRCVARWSGSAWVKLEPPGNSGPVRSIVRLGDDLIAGGYFEWLGGAHTGHVARWDGAAWSAFASPFPEADALPLKLVVHEDQLVVTVRVRGQNSSYHAGVYAWNGATWTGLGGSFNERAELTSFHGALYGFSVGGQADELLVRRIGATTWQPVFRFSDMGLRPPVATGMRATPDQLFLTTVDQNPNVPQVFSGDGETFRFIQQPPSMSAPRLLGVVGDEMFAVMSDCTGGCYLAGGNRVRPQSNAPVSNSIFAWNGESWRLVATLSPGADAFQLVTLDDSSFDLLTNAPELLGGAIDSLGIAHWDGTSWNPRASDLTEDVWDLQWHAGELWVAGSFLPSGLQPNAFISRLGPACPTGPPRNENSNINGGGGPSPENANSNRPGNANHNGVAGDPPPGFACPLLPAAVLALPALLAGVYAPVRRRRFADSRSRSWNP